MLAAAQQQHGQRQQQQLGALALDRQRSRRAPGHAGRGVAPQADGLRRLPLGLAHVGAAGAGGLPPVDAGDRLARHQLAVLPEAVAAAGAPAAVHALRHRAGDAVGLGQQRRQPGGQRLGLQPQPVARGGRPCGARSARSGAGAARPDGAQDGGQPHPRRWTSPSMITAGGSLGAGGEAQRHAVAQHRVRQGGDVVEAGRQPPVQQRARPRGQHQRLRRPRPGPPGQRPAHPLVGGGLRPGAAHQRQDRVHHLLADRQRRTSACAASSSPGASTGCARSRGAPVVASSMARSAAASGIGEVHLQQEAVELGLGQRIGALLLDRVLRRQHVERGRQRMVEPATATRCSCIACSSADCVRGLARLISSAISSWQNTGPAHEAEAAPAARVLLQDLGAGDVGRHQVGGELHAPRVEPEHGAQRLDQQRLAEPGRADQQRVAAGQQRDEHLGHHLLAARRSPRRCATAPGRAGRPIGRRCPPDRRPRAPAP